MSTQRAVCLLDCASCSVLSARGVARPGPTREARGRDLGVRRRTVPSDCPSRAGHLGGSAGALQEHEVGKLRGCSGRSHPPPSPARRLCGRGRQGAVATQCPGLQEGALGAAPPFPSEVSLGEPRGPHGRDCSYSGASCLGSGCDSGQKRCEPGLPQRWAARGAAGGKVSRHTVALLQELLGGKSFPVVLCPFSPYPPSGQ